MSAARPLVNANVKIPAKPGPVPGFVVLVAPAGSYRIAAYTRAAATIGMPILVVSNSEHSLVSEVAGGVNVDFDDPDHALDDILGIFGDLEVACVLATDDSTATLCSLLAERLGLPQNDSAAARLTARKDLAREALTLAGCRTPQFQRITIATADRDCLNLDYPVVVKPLSLSGSRGVIRANDESEFINAVHRIDAILDTAGQRQEAREQLLVESYIDGSEYAVEGFMVKGEFQLLTIFDKPEPLAGPFFEETCYLTPTRLDPAQKQSLIAEVASSCEAYGLKQGPVHAEARMTASGPVLIELAARTIGGQCGQLIEFSLGQKLEELVIQGMCGLPFEIPNEAACAGVLMIPIHDSGILKRVEGLTEALQTEFVRDIEIHIRPGYELIPLPEGASYLGFIFAQAPDYQQTWQALKNAHAKLRFVTQPHWQLQPSQV